MNMTCYDKAVFRPGRGNAADRMLLILIGAAALLASMIMVLITIFLMMESWPLLSKAGPLSLFSDSEWGPREGKYNLTSMLVSSVLLTFGALAITTPISIGFAAYCSFYCSRKTASALLRLVDISAGMPTVIYGFWGLAVLVPLISEYAPPGPSILAGVLVLSLMIFPTITVVTHSAIEAVPKSYVYASRALGVKRSATIVHIVFRNARAGILSAMTLGAARAIGETVVVLMVCGNVVQMPASVLDPVRTLTANIALEMPYAMGDHQSALYVTGLLVLLVVIFLMIASEAYARKQNRSQE